MRTSFQRTCCRAARVLFPVTALALFFTPHEADWELALAATAVLAGAMWIYSCGKWRRR